MIHFKIILSCHVIFIILFYLFSMAQKIFDLLSFFHLGYIYLFFWYFFLENDLFNLRNSSISNSKSIRLYLFLWNYFPCSNLINQLMNLIYYHLKIKSSQFRYSSKFVIPLLEVLVLNLQIFSFNFSILLKAIQI